MSGLLAFVFPPYSGNAIALVAYYAIFLVAQIGLAVPFIRSWNWPIFLGLIISLVFQIIGSVAYLKLHYTPFTGAWYNWWLVSLTIGPTFFISSLHFCVELALRKKKSQAVLYGRARFSGAQYLTVCCSIDGLALVLAIVGSAYASAKSSDAPTASQPGFDVVVAAMVVQLFSLLLTMLVGFNLTLTCAKGFQNPASDVTTINEVKDVDSERQSPGETMLKKPRLFLTFLCIVLFTSVLLFTRTIVRAIDVAGGVEGPLQLPLLTNVEHILVFVAILVITVMHPAFVLPSVN